MHVIGIKKPAKKFKPLRQEKTAEQRKNEELYGKSAAIYGTGKKKDGTLMANTTDWRNTQNTLMNSPTKQANGQDSKNCRDKKFENLSSNIFGNEDNNDRPLYNNEIERAAFGTSSDWT